MHPLRGYVPAIYSTRLTLTHATPPLATIPKPKKRLGELQPISPHPHSRCGWTEPPPFPQPRSGAAASLPTGGGVSLEGVLISKHLFIPPLRNLVQANSEVLGDMQTEELGEACAVLQNVTELGGKSKFSEEVCLCGSP